LARSDEILKFWFGDTSALDQRMRMWFAGGPQFDLSCREDFLADYERAVQGHLDDWKEDAHSCLALVLLLDQLPRNMFRNTPRAYAADAQARAVARHAMARGFDRMLLPLWRVFIYMPLEHSENLDDQRESQRLQRELASQNPECAGFVKYAEEHLAVIEQFGRFPQRNSVLGRSSTPREIAFLARESSN
jgi:uncharacterized protein (DUF924 family)